VRFFEAKGLRVHGAHEVAPDLLAGAASLGALDLGARERADAELGSAVRSALESLDAGQAVVVADGKVLAIEGAEGTDAMLRRVPGIAGELAGTGRRGVLTKGPKPGQELRVDMPVIGPRTVESTVAAGLAGIAVEAHSVLVLEREETLRLADASGCALFGLMAMPPVREPLAVSASRCGRLLGRQRPGARDVRDIEMGLAVVERLARFGTGSAAVVARSHVLAIAAAEPLPAMLERVRALRQWNDRRSSRRVGVLVRRVCPEEDDSSSLKSVLTQAAMQGLAGIAVVGPRSALAAYDGAGRMADQQGLFLATCDAAHMDARR
jgi:DUF1009 family protein